MEIVIITQDDPFYIPVFFETFFEKVNNSAINVESVVIQPSFDENVFSLIKRAYSFYGPFNFFKQGLKRIWLKLANKLGLNVKTIENLSLERKISVKKNVDVKSSDFTTYLKKTHPDIILSVSGTQIFGKKLLNIPSWGCINIHSAKLPKYRGMMPNFWAMYHGDDTAGITVHTMDEELDKGKIILQDEVEIRDEDTLDSLIKRSKRKGAELAVEALKQIRSGEVHLKDYEGEGSYFSFPAREDVKEFKRRGNKLL